LCPPSGHVSRVSADFTFSAAQGAARASKVFDHSEIARVRTVLTRSRKCGNMAPVHVSGRARSHCAHGLRYDTAHAA
jgi:hypothetical protein